MALMAFALPSALARQRHAVNEAEQSARLRFWRHNGYARLSAAGSQRSLPRISW